MPLVPVYTQTVESVLLGIGEGVTQLIVIKEQVEKAGAAMPDLTASANAVCGAILNLEKEARALSEETNDAQVKTDLIKACQTVEKAVADLKSATAKLKESPTDKAACQTLVDGARGTVNGTALLLEAFDQADVRNIVKQGQKVLDFIEPIRQVTTEQGLVETIKQIHLDLIDLAQLAEERQQVLTIAKLKEEIVAANTVVREQSPSILHAVKLFVLKPTNADIIENRNNSLARLKKAVEDTIRLVQYKFYGIDEVANPTVGKAFENSALHISRLVANPTQASAALAPHGDFAKQLDFIIQQGQQVANTTASAALRADILGHVQRVQAIKDELTTVAQKISANPNDQAAQTRYAQLMEELPRELKLLEKSMSDDAVEASLAVFASVAEPVSALVQAAQAGNAAGVAQQSAELKTGMATFVKANNNLANTSADAAVAAEIKALTKELEDLAPQIMVAARIVQENPTDKSALANLEHLTKQWDTKMSRLQALADSVASPHDVLAITEKSIKNEIAKAQAAVTAQDKAAFEASKLNIKRRAGRAAGLARAEMENNDAPDFRKKMAERLARIEASTKAAEAEMQKAYEAKNAPAVEKAVQPIIDDIKAVRTELGGSVDEISSKLGVASVTATDEPLPELPTGVSAQAVASHPIGIAANNLRQVTNRWDAKNNALVQAASRISDKMRNMAAFTLQASKKDLIDTAKSMASEVSEIVKMAKAAAESCSDRRLKANLLQLVDKIPTIATQLKIIASVKAANPEDSEAEHQLIAGSQNLMDVVTEIVKGAEAASLKSFASTANVAVTAIQWKRKALK